MKILIYTFAFAPRIGGVESSVRTLAEQLVRAEGEGLDDWLVKPVSHRDLIRVVSHFAAPLLPRRSP